MSKMLDELDTCGICSIIKTYDEEGEVIYQFDNKNLSHFLDFSQEEFDKLIAEMVVLSKSEPTPRDEEDFDATDSD